MRTPGSSLLALIVALVLVPALNPLAVRAQESPPPSDAASVDAGDAALMDAAPTDAAPTDAAPTEETASVLPAATAAAGDFEVGFTPSSGAYIRTHDRSWELRIGLLWQFRASFSSTPDPSREVEFVPVSGRFLFAGNVAQPWIHYFVQVEMTGQQNPYPAAPGVEAPRLLDYWLEAQPHEAFGVRVGMMRPPMSRSWIAGLNRQALFDRSDANGYFRNHGEAPSGSVPGTNPEVAADRDIGVMVFGTPGDGIFEYYAGIYNGNGYLLGRNANNSVMPLVRFAANPLGRMTYDETGALGNPHQPFRMQVGVSGYYNHYGVTYTDPTDPTMSPTAGTEEQYTLEGDLSAQFESVYLTTELYYRNRLTADMNRHDEVGATGIASWMFLHPYLEAAVRFSLVDPNLANAGDFRQAYDVGINVYPAGNNLRFGLRYTASLNDAIAGPVPAGTLVHTVSLWSQLSF